jgi:hypothetical protein
MKRIEQMSLWERAYVPEIVHGLSVTGYHFWRNLSIHILHAFGLAKAHHEAGEDPRDPVEKYAVRYEIDTLRCIYCGMCVEALYWVHRGKWLKIICRIPELIPAI